MARSVPEPAALVDLVAGVLREVIERAPVSAADRALLYLPLRAEGKILSARPHPTWSALVHAACLATGGGERAVPRVAAAVELLVASFDVLDDIEDGDPSPLIEALDERRARKVAATLLFLSQQTLADAGAEGLPPGRVPLLLETLARAGVVATGGQHLDLAAEGHGGISPEEALEIARHKTGGLTGGVCRLGALLGTTDEALLDLYERWGRHFGTLAQLANDWADALDTGGKSDWRRGKATVPLTFARRQAAGAGTGAPAHPLTLQDLRDRGALHFTWVVQEIEREACLALLDELAARGQTVAPLRAFLPAS